MDKTLKNSLGTTVRVAVGGATVQAVGNSSMPQGFKDITNIGVSAGIAAHSFKDVKKYKW